MASPWWLAHPGWVRDGQRVGAVARRANYMLGNRRAVRQSPGCFAARKSIAIPDDARKQLVQPIESTRNMSSRCDVGLSRGARRAGAGGLTRANDRKWPRHRTSCCIRSQGSAPTTSGARERQLLGVRSAAQVGATGSELEGAGPGPQRVNYGGRGPHSMVRVMSN